MCDPITIAAVTMAAGSAYNAYGQYQTGKYNAAVADENARLADISAEEAITLGEADVSRFRMNINQIRGRQRAAIGASNIEMSGSALDISEDTAQIGELEIATIRNNAARDAYGFRTQGLNYRAQGRLDRFAGRTGAIGTLLTGGAQSTAMVYG